MPLEAFVLRPSGWVSLDKNGEIIYSVINIHDGAMPVFSPQTVVAALEASYYKEVELAIAYHAERATALLEAGNYFLAKVHADAGDAIKEKASGE